MLDVKEFERVKGIIKEHWDDERNIERLIYENINLQEISYGQLSELINIIDPWIGFYLVIPTFMDKLDLKETEEIELANYIIRNGFVGMCMHFGSKHHIDAKEIISEIVRNNGIHNKYEKYTDERMYVLLNEALNNVYNSKEYNSNEYKAYGVTLNQVLGTLLGENRVDKEIVEILINREDIIKHIFTNKDYIFKLAENNHGNIYLGNELIEFTDEDLNKIYMRYENILLNRKLEKFRYVYMTFIEHREDKEIRKFLKISLNKDDKHILRMVSTYSKLGNFLSRNIDLKEMIEATVIMNELSK